MSVLVLSQPLSQVNKPSLGICSIIHLHKNSRVKFSNLKYVFICASKCQKTANKHSNSIIIRSRHTRGMQSQGICESELNANWHRHFGFGSVTTIGDDMTVMSIIFKASILFSSSKEHFWWLDIQIFVRWYCWKTDDQLIWRKIMTKFLFSWWSFLV